MFLTCFREGGAGRRPASARSSLIWPIAGVLLAIGITSTMDATGFTMFSALPLLPLMALFWYLQRFPRTEIGIIWVRGWHYDLAILYPLVVLGLATLIALINGAVDVSGAEWQKVGLNLVLMSLIGVPMWVLNEEGFFRGWLWASLSRAAQSEIPTLIWSSVAFAAWHGSWAVLDDGTQLRLSRQRRADLESRLSHGS